MTLEPPRRLRMFGGPNGSGKTSLVRSLAREFVASGAFHRHRYVNADDLQAALSGPGFDFGGFGFQPEPSELSQSLQLGGRLGDAHSVFTSLRWEGSRLFIEDCDAYTAAAVADFIRERLLASRLSFAFETVMSHRSKVDFLRRASEAGYRTYLYFVATDDPQLNVSRVRSRTTLGGHSVPPDKVISRYERSLKLLPEAMHAASRVYLFDNSSTAPVWLAEKTPEGTLSLKVPPESAPRWFRVSVLEEARATDA